MTPNCKICIDLVIDHEVGPFKSTGGFQMDSKDPGNWSGGKVGVGTLIGTKWGIAAAYHPGINIPMLTYEDAENIYVTEYWPKMRGDELPLPLAMATLDAEVMSGLGDARHVRAAGWLQQAINAPAVDGIIGPATVLLAQHADVTQAVQKLCALRLAFLNSLPGWQHDGNGWQARVVDTRQKALAQLSC